VVLFSWVRMADDFQFRRQRGFLLLVWIGSGLDRHRIGSGLPAVGPRGILGWTNRLTSISCAYLFIAAWMAARERGLEDFAGAGCGNVANGELLPALRKQPRLWWGCATACGSGGGGGVWVAPGVTAGVGSGLPTYITFYRQ